MKRLMPALSAMTQPRIHPQKYSLKALGINKPTVTAPVPVGDDDPNIEQQESDADAWCRSMREMDEHIEDILTGK